MHFCSLTVNIKKNYMFKLYIVQLKSINGYLLYNSYSDEHKDPKRERYGSCLKELTFRTKPRITLYVLHTMMDDRSGYKGSKEEKPINSV